MSSYVRVLRHHNFRSLFLGQAASAVGDYVVLVALVLFITRKTGSPTDVGLVLAAGSLPMVALLLFGGVWADRLPRHKLMISADAIRACLHTLLAALIFTGSVEVWQVVVIEALFGAATAFFQPAYTGLLPQMVPEGEIQDARALTQASQNVASLAGPALATALVLGLGAGYAFAFDGVTKVLGALLLVGVRPRARGATRPEAETHEETLAHALRVGWREVISRPWVSVTIAVFGFALMFVMAPWDTLAPTIAGRLYGGAGVFGLLVTVEGIGAVAAVVVGSRWKPARPLFTGLVIAIIWPVTNIAFALASPLALLVAISFATGLTLSLMMIWWEVALAQHIPPHVLSRVSAYDWMGSTALLPLGFLVAGPVAAALGARVVLGVGGAIGLVLLALALLPRSTRALAAPRSAPEPARTLAAELAWSPSPERIAGELPIAIRSRPEVAHVDALVGAVHERGAVDQRPAAPREEPVRDAGDRHPCRGETARAAQDHGRSRGDDQLQRTRHQREHLHPVADGPHGTLSRWRRGRPAEARPRPLRSAFVDEGLPVSYLALEHHVPIYDAEGNEVGHVHHVVAAPEKDIFHGIVMSRHADHFFIAADQIASLHEHGVDLKLGGEEVAKLPHPSGAAPAYRDREPGMPLKHAGWKKFVDLLEGKDPRDRNWRRED